MASNAQAHAELCSITFGYLKSMALDCAIKLGIPQAIHLCGGGGASLAAIMAAVPVPESRRPYLPRLMRFLAASGIFTDDAVVGVGEEVVYRLTPVSRLLVDHDGSGSGLSPFVVTQTSKHFVGAAMHLPDWFQSDDPALETPFTMAHGTDLWGVMMGRGGGAEVMNQLFNVGMASHSRFMVDFLVCERDVFEGVTSLVDVGGGSGTVARAIARAFPHVKCSVLDLPNVIESAPADDGAGVDYIAGDMMKSIPSADAVLLKHVLHDWSDQDCLKILAQCRKAIHAAGGKVIIVDMLVGSSPSRDMLQVQLQVDLLMMAITTGKERDEQQWRKIFMDAGFSNYETRPLMGFTSITQLYP
uniref:Uncharacterized protein n=1 Tax=Avena sativa TaxID=4498 RepID=A0ACD5UX94_AVESA